MERIGTDTNYKHGYLGNRASGGLLEGGESGDIYPD